MKKDQMILIILILITLGLTSCATAERTPVSETPAGTEEIPAPDAVLRGREWLAEELGVATDQIEVVRMEEVEWPEVGPPPDVAELSRHVTSNCPTANIFMGDFTQMLIGLRGGPRVEATTTGGDSFKKHQVLIKIVWRGDMNVEHAAAFHALTGITT